MSYHVSSGNSEVELKNHYTICNLSNNDQSQRREEKKYHQEHNKPNGYLVDLKRMRFHGE